MKKIISSALAIVTMLSLSVSAFAAGAAPQAGAAEPIPQTYILTNDTNPVHCDPNWKGAYVFFLEDETSTEAHITVTPRYDSYNYDVRILADSMELYEQTDNEGETNYRVWNIDDTTEITVEIRNNTNVDAYFTIDATES